MIRSRRHSRVMCLTFVAALLSIAVPYSSTAAAKSSSALVSPLKLHSLIRAAATMKNLPSNTQPSLSDASTTTGQFQAVAAGCTGYANLTSSPVKKCTFGDRSAKTSIVLLGDSHATMWLPAFDLIGRRLHFRVVDLWKASCGAVSLPFTPYLYSKGSSFPQCPQFLKWSIGEVNSLKPTLVVISEQDGDGSPPPGVNGGVVSSSIWQSSLAKTLEAIHSPNTQKVVLSDVDYLNHDVGGGPDCLAAHESNVQQCSEPLAVATASRWSGDDKAGATEAGAHFIDVVPWLCSTVCTAVIGNTLVFADTGHLRTQMTELASGALSSSLSPYLESNTTTP